MDLHELDYLINELEVEQQGFASKFANISKLIEVAFSKNPQALSQFRIESSSLSRSLEKIRQLSLCLGQVLISEQSCELQILMNSLKKLFEDTSAFYSKKIQLQMKSTNLKIDQRLKAALEGVFPSLVKSLVEFGIENEKERVARGKQTTAIVQMSAWCPGEDSLEIVFWYDGNGILPPISNHRTLSSAHTVAEFRGKPGISSEWKFRMPRSLNQFKVCFFESQGTVFSLPKWAFHRGFLETVKCVTLDKDYRAMSFDKKSDFSAENSVVVTSGTEAVNFLFDRNLNLESHVYLRSFDNSLDSEKKFLGLALVTGDHDGLRPVINPDYLVRKVYEEKKF